jgi:hypothetical protein
LRHRQLYLPVALTLSLTIPLCDSMGHGGGPKTKADPKPKVTKQQENAGKSATQKKAEQQAKKAAKNEKVGFKG